MRQRKGRPKGADTRTNQGSVQALTDQNLRVKWSGGDSEAEYVEVSGVFLEGGGASSSIQGGFTCIERATKGSFTVPASDLWTSDMRRATHLSFDVR